MSLRSPAHRPLKCPLAHTSEFLTPRKPHLFVSPARSRPTPGPTASVKKTLVQFLALYKPCAGIARQRRRFCAHLQLLHHTVDPLLLRTWPAISF